MFQALRTLDYQLLQQAVAAANQSPTAQALTHFLAEALIFVFPLVLFMLWRKPEVRGDRHFARKAVVLACMAAVGSLAVKAVIAFLWARPRPFISHPDLTHLALHVDPLSFPSGHALLAFTIASSLYLSGYRRTGGILLVLATLVALGRVFAGVHYPSDVLAGALIGVLVSWYLQREAGSLHQYLPNN